MFKRSHAVLFPALAACAFAATAQQAVQRGVQAASDSTQAHHGHHYVVAIGIDHYQNWPVLSTAVSDATGFAHLLTTQFGFEYAGDPLTEKNATREAINSLIDDDLRNRLQADDDLIIFFAGHGTTRDDRFGNQVRSVGFIVPFEARAPSAEEHWSDYINIDDLLRTIGSLPAAHILVILDSCHSGMALGGRFTSSRADTRFQQDMLSHLGRKVLPVAPFRGAARRRCVLRECPPCEQVEARAGRLVRALQGRLHCVGSSLGSESFNLLVKESPRLLSAVGRDS